MLRSPMTANELLHRAVGLVESAVKLDTTDVAAMDTLGSVLQLAGDGERAIEWHQRAIKIQQLRAKQGGYNGHGMGGGVGGEGAVLRSVVLYTNTAIAARDMGKHGEAACLFLKVIEMLTGAPVDTAASLQKRKQTQAYKKLLQQPDEELKRTAANAWMNFGFAVKGVSGGSGGDACVSKLRMLSKSELEAAAESAYRTSIELHAENAAVYSNLGSLLLRRVAATATSGERRIAMGEEVVALFERAVTIDPGKTYIYPHS